MIISIEISSSEAVILQISGKPLSLIVTKPSANFEITNEGVTDFVDFQKNIEMYFQNAKPEFVVLCTGSGDVKKKRIIMEYSILLACHLNGITYKTYPTNSASTYINTGFTKDYSQKFDEYYSQFSLAKKYQKLFASAIRFLK